ncbi:unnamed protein product [Cuscuta epithymum]|uniref:Uncharacterized protein n=1 Tax=Cuscuta epithymum TaxID=186058 RepID=A0AAV0DRG2_9ASTE|nr:unnamed protein product [Cuscuta epithymum]
MTRRRNITMRLSPVRTNSGRYGDLLFLGNYDDASPGNKDDLSNISRSSSSASTSSRRSIFRIGNNSLSSGDSPNNSTDSSPGRNPSGSSTYISSPWNHDRKPPQMAEDNQNYLIGSLVREDGHVYSIAVTGGLLYTGSDSKNIRVWKNLKDYSGFKSGSGFVKAIVVWGEKVFTGHQDGKIRIWGGERKSYKRVGSLPTTKDYLKSAINPKAYVEVRRKRNVPWLKHYDAVSCLSVDEENGFLYSGSWDKTVKVWRLSDSKCIESIKAHHDAVNSVAVGFSGLVFTGSADGTVKAWRREVLGTRVKHAPMGTLLKQDNAVTSLVVSADSGTVYAGSSDGLVNFWELENKFMVYGGVLRGHKLAVLCLAAAGNLVMSGSADKSICVWRRDEGGIHTCMSVLTGHTGPVKCLAVEEDREGEEEDGSDRRWIVYSGSLDKSVKVWSVSGSEPAPEC